MQSAKFVGRSAAWGAACALLAAAACTFPRSQSAGVADPTRAVVLTNSTVNRSTEEPLPAARSRAQVVLVSVDSREGRVASTETKRQRRSRGPIPILEVSTPGGVQDLAGETLAGAPFIVKSKEGTDQRDVGKQQHKEDEERREERERREKEEWTERERRKEDKERQRGEERELQEWLGGIRAEAVKRGIRRETLAKALDGVRPVPKVIEKDRNQPEFKLTCESYLERQLTEHRVKLGSQMLRKHEQLAKEISAKYGVPETILVALWGLESSYGNFPGSWEVVPALVTLAYDSNQPRRAAYFRDELFHALHILDDGLCPLAQLRGSWAGALGQCQFMPSSYRKYAVDHDGDGRADIWGSTADVLASIANYLARHGWRQEEPYGQRVDLPARFKSDLLGLQVKKPVKEWRRKYKVKGVPGSQSLPDHVEASVVAPDGPTGPAYLACHNFSTVMRYNASTYYAISAGELVRQMLQLPKPVS